MMTPKSMIPSRAPRRYLPGERWVLAAVALLLAQGVTAQTFPQRPMRAIVPFPAGASYDKIMRIVGNAVTESTGQPIVIENRPGASAIIGADALAKATPDGHTIGMLGNNHTILEALGRKTPYDLFKDFAPLMRIAVLDNVIVVRLTASQPVACFLLPPILAKLRLALPAIQIELEVSNQVSNLLRREADIAIRMVRPDQTSLVARKLGEASVGADLCALDTGAC